MGSEAALFLHSTVHGLGFDVGGRLDGRGLSFEPASRGRFRAQASRRLRFGCCAEGESGKGTRPSPAYPELKERLKRVNLYLVGMMGSGKTTMGKILAQGLRYMYLDTDEIIEKAAKKTVSQIFDDDGEEKFRALEHAVLIEVQAYVGCVISTGGGIVMDQTNWGPLQTGLVVWLNPTVETLFDRVKGDKGRPLLQVDDPHGRLSSILESRKDMYTQADVIVDITSSMSNEEIAFEIVRKLNNFIKSNPPKAKEPPSSLTPDSGSS